MRPGQVRESIHMACFRPSRLQTCTTYTSGSLESFSRNHAHCIEREAGAPRSKWGIATRGDSVPPGRPRDGRCQEPREGLVWESAPPEQLAPAEGQSPQSTSLRSVSSWPSQWITHQVPKGPRKQDLNKSMTATTQGARRDDRREGGKWDGCKHTFTVRYRTTVSYQLL